MAAPKNNQNASKFDMKIVEEVCLLVANGLNIKTALNQSEKYPSFETWCRWKRENNIVYDLYINSIQDKTESLDYELDELKQMLLENKITPATYNTLAQTIKWKMAKYYPKMFGDKVDVTSGGEKIESPVDPLAIIREYVTLNKQANSGS